MNAPSNRPIPPSLPTVDALIAYGRKQSLANTRAAFPPWSFRAYQRLGRLAITSSLCALVFWILATLLAPGLTHELATLLAGIVAGALLTTLGSIFLAAVISLTSAWEADSFNDHPAGTLEARHALLEAAQDHHRAVDLGFVPWLTYAAGLPTTADTLGDGYRAAGLDAQTIATQAELAALKDLAHQYGRDRPGTTRGRRELDLRYRQFVAEHTPLP